MTATRRGLPRPSLRGFCSRARRSALERDTAKVQWREHSHPTYAEAEHGDGIGFDGVELDDEIRSGRRLSGQPKIQLRGPDS
ncbi:MAG: hypothetical protein DI538_11300 [Azospira oryzae]|nr:MAG: hypothetical protein DI538_11300 [Azospira oryzae]